ncbi:hypothetical protein LO772_10215 [Yinghuangia sp. ASG 101]|uniref:hypothetical protein n=1 Tax=Yinghuangia sp. ASG 101 TaxID=2896848 RepID=UPI001E365B46|nr:hypothetical protein [Yinghuangia sp. ASG 101]UGQ13930.1 hypothetical protein LO772_10215 [Yinghuangia sp. ASG 101]
MTSTPSPAPRVPRVVVLAAAVAVLAIVAAVIAFMDGSWLGIPFVLLAAVDGNIAWFYLHRARRAASASDRSAETAA